MNTVLWIVVPCYNEEEVLPVTSRLFREELGKLVREGRVSEDSRILFVNDGSRDRTWEIIQELAKKDPCFVGICQSRNRGHQNAVLAGLMEAKEYADITISIDCDGQDDIAAMEKMVDAYHEGSEIVYGVRSSRKSDTFFKRATARGFYRFLNRMGAEVVYDHADYRLVSRRVLNAFADYREVNLFLRGMFPLVGFRSTCVSYERHERMAGESHYPLSKMLVLALEGITSTSIRPLHLIAAVGILVSLLGLAGIIWAVVVHFLGQTIAGWTSLLCVSCFLGGIQLLAVGILGEYIGKTYMEAKGRPRYIISERTYRTEEEEKEKPKRKPPKSAS